MSNLIQFVTAKTPMEKWAYQVYRRVQRWYVFDPEYKDHMPTSHIDYRATSPGSQPIALIPTQEFMKDFHVKYYKRDYREGGEGDRTQNLFKIIWRDEAIEKPVRLQKGETVGPFYDFGLGTKTALAYDERENTQVYTYLRPRTPQFHDSPKTMPSPQDYIREEQERVAQKIAAKKK